MTFNIHLKIQKKLEELRKINDRLRWGRLSMFSFKTFCLIHKSLFERNEQWAHKQTNKQTNKQTKETNKQTNKQTNRPLIHPTKNKGKKTARYITTCSMLGNIYQGHFPLVHVVIVLSYQAHLGNQPPLPVRSRMLDWWRARFVSSWPLPAHMKQVCASDWCKFFTVFFTLSSKLSKPRWRWLEIHLFQKERQTTHSWSTFQPAMLGPYRRMRTHSLGS